jgi:AraC family transcriptional regulator
MGERMTERLSQAGTNIEAHASFALGHAEIVRRSWDEPIDVVAASHEHRLEFAMLPRSTAARGWFPDRQRTVPSVRIGEVFFFPAGEVVHATSHCRQQYSIVCSFRREAVDLWFQSKARWTDAQLQASLDIINPNIRNVLFRLGEEMRNPSFASAAMIELLAGQINIELGRYFVAVGEPLHTGGLSSRHLRMIDERLAQSGAAPALTELADLCGLSVRHLTRAFRTSRRRSIGDVIAERRIEQAKQLLGSGASVKSIAHTMGFGNPAALSVAFRRATGERPRDYLQRVGRKRE